MRLKNIFKRKKAQAPSAGQPNAKKGKKKATSSDGRWGTIYESITRLLEHGLLEIRIDSDKPSAFLSLSCYRAFCCGKEGIFVDDKRALAFLENVRFYMNFRRAYLSGLKQGVIDEALERDSNPEEDKWTYPPLSPDQWINIYVAGSDEKSILLYGRWNSESLELRAYKTKDERQKTKEDKE